jgi:hypothetical protein
VKREESGGRTTTENGFKSDAQVWRTHIAAPKTEGSVAPVPVIETLRSILNEQRRDSGFILAGPLKKPINLSNLARRVIVPALQKKQIPWYGWYALRRGIATLATAVENTFAAKGLLRHTNVSTTAQFYVKDARRKRRAQWPRLRSDSARVLSNH